MTRGASRSGLPEESDDKKRLWKIDPAMYQKGPRTRFLERRIIPSLRHIGKWVLIGLAVAYPIYLVYVGVAFGGIVFWAFLAASFGAIGVIITRLGFASNFRNWDMGMKRMGGIVLGFLVAMGFYGGLIYLKTWFIPAIILLAAFGLYLAARRLSS
jgi:hypothetical protein